VLLDCPAGKGWRARQHGSRTWAEHPGTAVRWDGELYEVFGIEPLEGTAVRYRLVPWDHRHAIRSIEPYDRSAEDARVAHRAHLESGVTKRWLSIVFSPLVGHLPGAVQKRMEHDFGAPAIGMTVASALPLFVLGFAVVFASRIGALTGSPFVPEWMLEQPALFTYLALESAVRLYSALAMSEPMGSVAGWSVYTATQEMRKPAKSQASPPATSMAPRERALRDRYTMLEPLLALLPESDQENLERHFAFDPLRWGRLSANLILFVAGANVLISVFAFLSRTDRFLDFAALLIGGYFIREQMARRRRLRGGKPAASVLGFLVFPLARPLLEAARAN
jgi:hypothetical protein